MARSQRRIALCPILRHPDVDPAAIGHRVARVDREIEDRKLELVGIDPRRRQALGNIEPQRHARPERAFEQIDHAFDQRPQIDRHRAQILLAGEGQQPLGQRCAAFGALDGAVDQPLQARIVRQALAQQIEIAHHGHQQIVEVMRDAAGELADGLHLLGLAQLLLRLFAGGHGLDQIGRSLLDALLKGRGQFRQRRALGRQLGEQVLSLDFRRLARGDVGANADQRADAAIRPAHRAGAHVDPMLRAVRPDIAVFDAVIAARRNGLIEHRKASRPVVGMNRRQQILVGKRLARLPSEKADADVGSFQLVVRQMQFQRAEMAGVQRRLQQIFAFRQIGQDGPGLDTDGACRESRSRRCSPAWSDETAAPGR